MPSWLAYPVHDPTFEVLLVFALLYYFVSEIRLEDLFAKCLRDPFGTIPITEPRVMSPSGKITSET